MNKREKVCVCVCVCVCMCVCGRGEVDKVKDGFDDHQ